MDVLSAVMPVLRMFVPVPSLDELNAVQWLYQPRNTQVVEAELELDTLIAPRHGRNTLHRAAAPHFRCR